MIFGVSPSTHLDKSFDVEYSSNWGMGESE